MPNERPHSFLGNWGNGAFYSSPSAGGFNPTVGIMRAAALVYPTGAWLDVGAFDNFLWGNLSGLTGWGLLVEDVGAIQLVARYGDGAGLVSASYSLDSATNLLGISERLVLLGITLDIAGGVALEINGQVVASTPGDPYVPSATAVRMGKGQAADDSANGILINSVGYRNNAGFGGNLLAGTMFRLAREGRELGFIANQAPNFQADWDHLYLASDAVGAETPEITTGEDAGGNSSFFYNSLLTSAAALPDRGNRSLSNPQAVTPIALARTGSDADGPFVSQIANPDYYGGAGALALLAPIP